MERILSNVGQNELWTIHSFTASSSTRRKKREFTAEVNKSQLLLIHASALPARKLIFNLNSGREPLHFLLNFLIRELERGAYVGTTSKFDWQKA